MTQRPSYTLRMAPDGSVGLVCENREAIALQALLGVPSRYTIQDVREWLGDGVASVVERGEPYSFTVAEDEERA